MTMGKLFDKLLNRKKERHPRCAALVPAAGRSERMGGTDKLTAPLCGVPVLSMHAPFEVVAKVDCYEMYRACKALYEAR